MKSTKSTGKMKKIKAKLNQLTLKNVLKVKDPKLSRVSIVQNNVYAAVHGTIGKARRSPGQPPHCYFDVQLWLSRRLRLAANIALLTLSYLGTPVRK